MLTTFATARLFARSTLTLTKFTFRPFTVEPSKLVYSYEGKTEFEHLTPKPEPKRNPKKKLSKRQRFLEEKQFRARVVEQIDAKVHGRELVAEETKEQIEEDEVFADKAPPVRKYYIIHNKELYWRPRPENLEAILTKRLSYLKEMLAPFSITDQNITSTIQDIKQQINKSINGSIAEAVNQPDFSASEAYKQCEGIASKFEVLTNRMSNCHFKLLPNIALSVAFDLRYKEDIFGFWNVFEREALRSLHQYSLQDLAKLKFALNGTFPKACSPKFHQAIRDLVVEELKGDRYGLDDLLAVYQAFRNANSIDVQKTVLSLLVEKRDALFKNLKGDVPSAVASALFTFANCRVKDEKRPSLRHIDDIGVEADHFIKHYLTLLENNLLQMNIESLARVTLALSLLRRETYGELFVRLENAILRKTDTIQDASILADIVTGFGKLLTGRAGGRAALWAELEKLVVKHFKQFSRNEASRVMFAFAARGVANEKLANQLFLPFVSQNMLKFDYAELQNVAYYLMFTNVTDKEIWKNFVRNVAYQKHTVPLHYYFALKIARYYMHTLFPKWNYAPYEDACVHAERVFNTSRVLPDRLHQDYEEFTAMLKQRYKIKFHPSLEWENLYLVDYAILPQKIAVILQRERDCLPNTTQARPAHLLRNKILADNGWRVVNVNWSEFLALGPKRDEWFQEEFKKAWEATNKKPEEYDEDARNEFWSNQNRIYMMSTTKEERETDEKERQEEEAKKAADKLAEKTQAKAPAGKPAAGGDKKGKPAGKK